MEEQAKTRDTFLRLLQYVSSVFVFLLPLTFFPYSNNVFELPKLALFHGVLFLSFIIVAIKIFQDRGFFLHVSFDRGFFLSFVAFFLVIILSTIFSQSFFVSFFGSYFRLQGFLTWTSLFLFFFLILYSFDAKRAQKLIQISILGSFFVAFYGVSQHFSLDPFPFWKSEAFVGRVFSTLGQPNFLAQYLVILIPITFLFSITSSKSFLKIFYSFTLIFQLLALFFSGSRASFLGLLIEIFFLFATWIIFYKKFSARKIIFTSLFCVFVLISLSFITLQWSKDTTLVRESSLISRLTISAQNLRSLQTRLLLWPVALKIITARPIFGHGLETFYLTFPQFQTPKFLEFEEFTATADRAHQLFLDIGLQMGFFGIFVFILMLFFLARLLFRFFRFSYFNSPYRFLILGIFVGLIGLITSLQFSFFTLTDLVFFFFFIALLLIFIGDSSRRYSLNGIRFLPFLILPFLILPFLVFFLLFIDLRNIKADLFFKNANAIMQIQGPKDQTLAFYDKASVLSFGQSFYDFYFVHALIEGSLNVSLQKKYEYLQKALSVLDEIENRTPRDYNPYLLRGRTYTELAFYFDKNFFKSAFSSFEQAKILAPSFPDISQFYGDSLYTAQDYEGAIKQYKYLLTISPPYWQWKFTIEQKTHEEREKYRIFFKLNPHFSRVFLFLARAYFQTGNIEKALYYLDFSEENIESLTTYGVIYGAQGDAKTARSYYEKALKLDPNNTLILKNLELL